MRILMHFSMFNSNWFLMIFFFFFFDDAIHGQDRLFTFFSNRQGRQIYRLESRTKENDNLSILPNFITFSVIILSLKNELNFITGTKLLSSDIKAFNISN